MTDPATGFETLLLNGMAAYLAANSIGTWNTSAIYTSGQTGIVIGDLLDSPVRQIALDTYGVSDDPTLSDSVIALQVRCRWLGADPRPAMDLAALIYNLMHGADHLTLTTGVLIVQCWKQSGPIGLGKDAAGNRSNVTNYYLSCHRPSTNRE